MTEIKNGMTAKDVITGFTGLVTGTVQYFTGCNQVLLTPTITEDGKRLDSQWFDIERVELVSSAIFDLPAVERSGRDEPLPSGH